MIAALARWMRRRSRWRSESNSDHPLPDRVSIFVTVGTELPFDRLVSAIDEWAGRTGRGPKVFAQIGHTDLRPVHIGWAEKIDGPDFRRVFAQADLIVAHAGMGTVLAALQDGRPLIVVPRRADLHEHRNDHQLSTARRLSERRLVQVADDEQRLTAMLDQFGSVPTQAAPPIGEFAEPGLIDAVRDAIQVGRDGRSAP